MDSDGTKALQGMQALAALMAATLALLRLNGILSPQQIETVFQFADAGMPDSALPHGIEVMAAVRSIQAQCQSDADEC